MTEQEEFEFRLRLEQEQQAARAPEVAPARESKPSRSVWQTLANTPFSPAQLAINMATKPETRRDAWNGAAGLVRGAADIGDSILRAGAWVGDKAERAVRVMPDSQRSSTQQWNDNRRDALEGVFRENADTDSGAFFAGRLASNIAGTAGVGGMVAKPVAALAQYGGRATPVLDALASSIRTGGFTTGQQFGRAADLGIRTAGGAINGLASGALTSPEEAGNAALFGAAAPGAMQVLGAGGRLGGSLFRNIRTPRDAKLAADVADISGVSTQDPRALKELADGLRGAATGPRLVDGPPASVAEIMRDPNASQLARTMESLRSGPFAELNAAREAGRLKTLERVAPYGNAVDVQDEVGRSISDYATAAREGERKSVNRLFESVDPMDEVRLNLPIDEMTRAREKYLGRGFFGHRSGADNAIRTAEEIGTEVLPGIQPIKESAKSQPQTLIQAVRKAGGIHPLLTKGFDGEIAEFARRESGTTGLINKKSGRSLERLAVQMHERGFIQSNDPADLIEAMRASLRGEGVYANDVVEDAFRGRLERSMGDAPTEATRIPKPVNWRETQNLRSGIGEAWNNAQKQGYTRESAAPNDMTQAIDNRVDDIILGRSGAESDYFPMDAANRWREAIGAHKSKMERFETGPQIRLFRQGGDGLPAAQGGEVPRLFFNSKPSQREDMEGFLRMVKGDEKLVADLRRYAISDAARQVDRNGALTNAKFSNWLDSRQEATGQLFTDQQRLWLKAVADDLKNADKAQEFGRVRGNSDTAQKLQTAVTFGLAESPVAQMVARKVPFGEAALRTAGDRVRNKRVDRMAELLNDPEEMAKLLELFTMRQAPRQPGSLFGGALTGPAAYRAAPVLLTSD